MFEFVTIVILNVLGLLFIFLLVDRYWGAEILGELIKPRSELICEGRPLWMKNITMITTMGVLVTVFLVTSIWFIIPSALNELLTPLGTIWVIILLGIGINIVSRDKTEST